MRVLEKGQKIMGEISQKKNGKSVVANIVPIIVNQQITGGISVVKNLSEIEELIDRISHLSAKTEYLEEELHRRKKLNPAFNRIVGVSNKLYDAMKLAAKTADNNFNVLIRGESGTGKELIAEAIHYSSERATQPFIRVNCAAIPENLLESEMFGHVKGAYTGAIKTKIGKFELADKGTIFLDEIGELDKSMQAKMACADGIQEYIETLQDLKANNAEKEYLNGLEQKVLAVEQRSIVSEFGTAAFVVSANMILKLGIATVALVGAILLSKGTIDVLTFFLFLLVASRLYDPLQGALQNLAAIISTRTNVARMNEILDHPTQQGADVLSNQGCDITFSHVGFAYDNGETILKDISFTAKQGAVTALVGPSGSGKTTVSRLAARFWDTKQGTITVGGMDISKVDPETLMTLYSIVFQDVTLFHDTILENIRLGKKGATDEEVLRAAKLANCDEFAEKLPNGYQTMIGENGSALSGGERQRISIARAFLKDAPIILLDEATASLDVENETLIQTALSRLIANKTVLMIAHRMRTVANADKVLVLKDGTIVESGTPEELMQKQNGLFRHMTELQKQSSVWEVGK